MLNKYLQQSQKTMNRIENDIPQNQIIPHASKISYLKSYEWIVDNFTTKYEADNKKDISVVLKLWIYIFQYHIMHYMSRTDKISELK